MGRRPNIHCFTHTYTQSSALFAILRSRMESREGERGEGQTHVRSKANDTMRNTRNWHRGRVYTSPRFAPILAPKITDGTTLK